MVTVAVDGKQIELTLNGYSTKWVETYEETVGNTLIVQNNNADGHNPPSMYLIRVPNDEVSANVKKGLYDSYIINGAIEAFYKL